MDPMMTDRIRTIIVVINTEADILQRHFAQFSPTNGHSLENLVVRIQPEIDKFITCNN